MAGIGDFQGLCAEYKEDLDKKDKEIEQYKHTWLEHHVKEIKLLTAEIDKKDEEIEQLSDLNKAKGALIKAQAKKIGMLRKEKEWLLTECARIYIDNGFTIETMDAAKKWLINTMQQSLKESK